MRPLIPSPPLRLVFVSSFVIAIAGLFLLVDRQSRHKEAPNEGASNLALVQNSLVKNSVNESISNVSRLDFQNALGNVPMSFEVNEGQTDKRVKFLARGTGYSLFLTSTEAVLALNRKAKSAANQSKVEQLTEPRGTEHIHNEKSSRGDVLRMSFAGANRSPKISGLDELPGKSNYFLGKDPAKWRRDISAYDKVRYESIYPGVDAVFYGNQGELEYDLVVAPHADYKRIRLRYEGVRRLSIDRTTDDLIITTNSGDELRQRNPILYQLIEGHRHEVVGQYVLKAKDEVAFRIDDYDTSRTLVIDPILSYSTYLGGSSGEIIWSLKTDSVGNAYVTGQTSSTNFPVASAFQATKDDFDDAFVAKLDPTGSFLLYSTYIGGDRTDIARDIAIDGAGNAFITGTTGAKDFPVTVGAFQTALGGDQAYVDAFVTKLNATGNSLVYSTYVGGQSEDGGYGIAVDSSGQAYVTGFTSYQFPITSNALQTSLGSTCNCPDAFLTKINGSGTDLIYSTYLGGWDRDIGYDIAVDSAGNAYVTGSTQSLNFRTANAAQATCVSCNSYSDSFVTKINTAGSGASSLVYSTFLGGDGIDFGNGITVDNSGHAYVTGRTDSANFPIANPLQSTKKGTTAAFVAKLNTAAAGTASLLYSTYQDKEIITQPNLFAKARRDARSILHRPPRAFANEET